mmetsp:Transcript_21970/g.53158  ORF Transcript_21970/g.53158 Transcript_21970/m.53158 type:complete len:152 (-) Transcript_21970:78-533(-)
MIYCNTCIFPVVLLACLVNVVKGKCEGTRVAGSCVGEYMPTACTFTPLGKDECTEVIRPQCEEVCETYLDCRCTQTEMGTSSEIIAGMIVTSINYNVQCKDIFAGNSCITLDEDKCESVNGCSWNSASIKVLSFSTLIASVAAALIFDIFF